MLALSALAGASAASAGTVVARFNCRSFGQTASSGGALNIKYATPMMCWASASTVSGVAVNETGWVPEVAFDWNWDDTSLGSVTRGGVATDLGKSVGLVAAHAFKPASFAESCGGGTNSLHTVRLTVTAVVNGVRDSNTATMNVCVENPATTWPNPVAFCDDSNCADDPGVPRGAVHGGNLTDLATILRYCETNGSARVVLEGGVTFSTGSTGISVGGRSCLIESYGTGRARLRFTSTSTSNSAIGAGNAACAGFRLHNVTLAGSGTGPRIISGSANTGCYVLLDSDVSTRAGEEFAAESIVDPTGTAVQSEGYYIKFNYTRQSASGLPANFIYGNYTAFVGGEVSGLNSSSLNQHLIRLPQWQYVVIDAMVLEDQTQAHTIATLRQDCGGTTSCPNSARAGVAAITRNQVTATAAGTDPLEFCTPGSGTAEQTKCGDIDLIANLIRYDAPSANDFPINFQGGGSAGARLERIRLFQNALDASALSSGNGNRLANTSGVTGDLAAIGNVIVSTANNGTVVYSIVNSSSTILDVAKNNVCYENSSGRCDIFPSLSESPDNVVASSDPFDGDSGEPASGLLFQFPELRITTSSPLSNAGTIDPIPMDVAGTLRQNGAADPGVYEAGGSTAPAPTPPPPTSAPAAPVLL